MRGYVFFVLALVISSWLTTLSNSVMAAPVQDYLPDKVKYDPKIPTPEQVLGFELGDHYLRHDQVLRYMQTLADTSSRVSIKKIGQTHELRDLVLMQFSAADMQPKLEAIRQQHIEKLATGQPAQASDVMVLWMGYSVHGDESSGSNAALAVAYYLAAAQGEHVNRLLNNSVVLLDPSLNPDGLDRFAMWSNMHRGSVASADPAHREHIQDWPTGRTNHFWFDLNRDWLLLQHPESIARIEQFHLWKPNVLTDFHEMGTDSTYFFQPGIATRTHPLTPVKNTELTKSLAAFHAQAFDQQGQLYFTQESFDDFYYGKGSTYPDINGSLGILFEQGSSRGKIQESINGVVTFEQAIKNQVTASLSTFQGALINKKPLLDYQADFYSNVDKQASDDPLNGYLLSEKHDSFRLNALLTTLKRHQIEAYQLTKDLTLDNQNYGKDYSYFVPLAQPQYRLIKAIFSTQKQFQDNTFYDVSAWTLPYAYNIEFKPVKRSWGLKTREQAWQVETPKLANVSATLNEQSDYYAYGLPWDDYLAPKFLSLALQAGIIAKVSSEPFNAITQQGQHSFARGTILFAKGVQTQPDWRAKLTKIEQQTALTLLPIKSGLTPIGADLGSRSMYPVALPKVLIIGGKGVSQYEVGEMWYYMDRYLAIAPTIVEANRIAKLDLSRYSHIVMAQGNYDQLSKSAIENITAWVKQGGTIFGQKSGAAWLVDNKLLKTSYLSKKEMADRFETANLTYGEREALQGQQRIAGAIYKTELDLTHPLAFGYSHAELPVFKNSTMLLMPAKAPFTTVAKYTEKPLLAGFSAARNVEQIAKGVTLIAHNHGKGRVIASTDNVNFRGFWYGTSRIFSNALFFSKVYSTKAE
ncbi:M14 family zinc carboxypeptidase [Flocculibacter collagenilyticus]|uniref:M14 family zinc carboxypeptidase n=1 Tax=Flocculibacter collagenilyticus TaxID=2744479 RepID=UPI0018F2BDF0|nr:M14 family zinc carboxypeptidase [Flocculibacter collagenilyticus]